MLSSHLVIKVELLKRGAELRPRLTSIEVS